MEDHQSTVLRHLPGMLEMQLLALNARMKLDDAAEKRIREICMESIDWALLINLADAHNVVPLLFSHLKRLNPVGLPPNILKALNVRFIELSRRSLLMQDHIRKLVKKFDAQNIPYQLLGGPLTGEKFFGDMLFHTFNCLEIFVNEDNFPAVADLLLAENYTPLKYKDDVIPGRKFLHSTSLRKVCDAYTFVKDPEQVFVRIYWRMLPTIITPQTPSPVQSEITSWTCASDTFKSISPELFLAFYCARSSAQSWQLLSMVSTILAIAESDDIDLEKVENLALELGLERTLYLGLYLTSVLSPSQKVSNFLRQNEKSKNVEKAGDRIHRALFGFVVEDESPLKATYRYLLTMRSKTSQKATLLFFEWLRPSLEDHIRVQLPDYLFALQYCLHPINLLSDWLTTITVKNFNVWRQEKKLVGMAHESP